MNYYGDKELAASFRTVRNNTIQVAEEIPESKYAFKAAPDVRSVGQTLVHIAMGPTFQLHVHQNRFDDLMKVNFQELMGKAAAEEATPRSKAEIIAFLRAEGEKFASYLESLPESFLAERVTMPPGGAADREKPLRDAPVSQRARDAPSRAAHAGRADDRSGAAPDASISGAHGGPGARLTPAPRFGPKAIAFLRGLKRHNDRDWFNARKGQCEEFMPAPMIKG